MNSKFNKNEKNGFFYKNVIYFPPPKLTNETETVFDLDLYLFTCVFPEFFKDNEDYDKNYDYFSNSKTEEDLIYEDSLKKCYYVSLYPIHFKRIRDI
jgi:hypothetical protein